MVTLHAVYTDDEIIALARVADVRWNRQLPTVDLMDAKSVAGAEFRGIRSLGLRDLRQELVGDKSLPSLVADLSPVAVATTVDDELLVSGDAARIEWFSLVEGTVEVHVLPNGTHFYSLDDSVDLTARIAALMADRESHDPKRSLMVLFPAREVGFLGGAHPSAVNLADMRDRRTLGHDVSERGWRDLIAPIVGDD